MLWWVCGASNKGSVWLERLQGMPIAIQLFVGVEVKKAKNGETKSVIRRASRCATIRMY
jgi:hypothetical protein